VGPSPARIEEDLEPSIAATGNQPRNRGSATLSKEELVDVGNPGPNMESPVESDRIRELRQTLAQRLSEGESEMADFKREGYRLDSPHPKAGLIKDILSFSNSVERPGDRRCIFVGVARDPHGGNAHDIPGIMEHPDDANLQGLVREWTRNPPPFIYRSFEYGGVSIGVYEMRGDVHLPYVAARMQGDVLWAGVVYVRRGSRNDLATPEEIHSMVERRQLWNPLQAAAPRPAPVYGLSIAAEDLLATAGKVRGEIHILSTDQTGSWVRAGPIDYLDEADPAIAAAFIDALEHLVTMGYARAEGAQGTYFKLTGKGWALARRLIEQHSH
jgi:hypothetical protein